MALSITALSSIHKEGTKFYTIFSIAEGGLSSWPGDEKVKAVTHWGKVSDNWKLLAPADHGSQKIEKGVSTIRDWTSFVDKKEGQRRVADMKSGRRRESRSVRKAPPIGRTQGSS